jgi:serine/threonine protein kinase
MTGEELESGNETLIITPPRIGDYAFRGTIGEGAFALVKLVQHSRTHEYFACKIVPRDRLNSDALQLRFEAEIRTHQRVRHPGIVRLFELLRDSSNFYIIMEFCPNGDLFQAIIDRNGFPEPEAQPYVRQILDSIRSIHQMGVSHRDLKPENLLIDRHYFVKLSDFGLASFLPPDYLLQTPCGSPCYASPECISGQRYDGRATDLWSIGVITFALVTGALPWTERNQTALFRQICKGAYRIPKGLSPECVSFIKGLLTVDISKRLTAEQALAHPWLAVAVSPYPDAHINSCVTDSHVTRFFDGWLDDDLPDGIKDIPSMRPAGFTQTLKWLKNTISRPQIARVAASVPANPRQVTKLVGKGSRPQSSLKNHRGNETLVKPVVRKKLL